MPHDDNFDDDLDDDLALFEQQIQQVVAKPPPPPPPPSKPSPAPPPPPPPTTTTPPHARTLSTADPVRPSSSRVPQYRSAQAVSSAPAAPLPLPKRNPPTATATSAHPTKPVAQATPTLQSAPVAPASRAATSAAQTPATVGPTAPNPTHHWKWDGSFWRWVERANKPTPAAPPVLLRGRPLGPVAPGLIAGPQRPTVSAPTARPPAPPARSPSVSSGGSGSGSTPGVANRAIAKRTAAGQVWSDTTLTEWPADDHRVFVGDLAPDATDDELERAFCKYASFNMARVVRDRRTGSCRGYGFVSFSAATDMIAAIKEMNGKYVGSRPVKLKRSTWEKRVVDKDKRKQLNAFRSIAKR